jgi:hypothetical protein
MAPRRIFFAFIKAKEKEHFGLIAFSHTLDPSLPVDQIVLMLAIRQKAVAIL